MEETEINALIEKTQRLKEEIHKVIIGQKSVIHQLIVTLIAGGHALIEGVPGLAKTLMIRSLSQAMDLDFQRIQFTPDLMPSDIIGTEILVEDLETNQRQFQFLKGPLFANIILADEINRTPPKTQAALLEAMQEKAVTFGGKTHQLAKPYFILATQNPIEQAGTFRLPEAQLDRFLLYIKIDYPTAEEEYQMLEMTTSPQINAINPVITGAEISQLQKLVKEVHISPDWLQYINELIRNTRPQMTTKEVIQKWVKWGAGPRAGQALILTAKANALLSNRFAVTKEDINAMIHPVLRHRLLPNFQAEVEEINADQIIDELVGDG